MEYKSSLSEVDFFIDSTVYEDMRGDFEDWLEGAKEQLEKAEDIKQVYRRQGRIDVLRDVLNWAENLRDVLEEELDNDDYVQ